MHKLRDATEHRSADHQVGSIERHPEISQFDNPFKQKFQLFSDLDSSLELMRHLLPVHDLSQREQSTPWWQYGVRCPLGEIHGLATILPPARMVISERERLTLCIGYGGDLHVQQGSFRSSCPKDGCLLLSPEACATSNSLVSAVVLGLCQDRLLDTAMAMAGRVQIPSRWRGLTERSHAWSPDDAWVVPFQTMLRQVMGMAHQLADISQSLIGRLQLEEQIYRLMAVMLLPELRQDSPLDRVTERHRQGRDSFDELIDFIKLNLSEPLNLTMLERRSHFSRRALQYAFQNRLGCTATQWIRNQRLDLARQRLQNPSPGDSVTSIATLSGYRSLSLFSVDFQQRFHIKPSQLLREAHACRPPETR